MVFSFLPQKGAVDNMGKGYLNTVQKRHPFI
jgi:hypothetical protein